jgi:sugar O-acyltransferase (sialic acid O-acetyltransferase NeuD family)
MINPKIIPSQRFLIIGTILGGSSIIKPQKGKNCYLSMRDKDLTWLKFKADQLKDLTSQSPLTIEKTNRWHSVCYPIFNEFYKMFYDGKDRIIKIDNLNFNISFVSDLYNIDNIFLGVYKPKVKFALFEQYKKYSEFFTNIIHKSSQISTTTNLGYGCLINSLVSIAAHSNIGNFVTINRNSTIGHHTIIGDYVSINPGVNVAGNVIIGNNTLIGMGTNIIDGIKIGKNSIIGAGSLVTKDIPDNVIAYGNPCKIIRENETQSL